MNRPTQQTCILGLLLVAFVAVLLFPAAANAQAKNVCLDCHSTFDGALKVTAAEFAGNIHAQKGLSCDACHGGDTQNEERAMTPAAGFRGAIARQKIPELCGSCHSDANRIKQFNPSLRTDQLSEYRTSVHGLKLAKGDTHVAVCTDCHTVHDIRPASDSRSSVHPLNVANTCKRCHADAEYMKAYKIPTDQFVGYSASAHNEAMAVRGDLSAPTCTTCHGNHGATPPGVNSVTNVCSTCHLFQSNLFDASPHKAAFKAAGLPGCVTCHSNHRINHTDDEMVGESRGSVCARCHKEGDRGMQTAAAVHERLWKLKLKIASAKSLLDRAANSGMEVGDSQVELAQANDALMKARVSVHSAKLANVEVDIQAGQQIVTKVSAAGEAALKERSYRRKGLALSAFIILAVVLALGTYIRDLERKE